MKEFRITGYDAKNAFMLLSARNASASMDFSVFSLRDGNLKIGSQSIKFEKGYFDLSTLSGILEIDGQEIPISMKVSHD